jgi:hypothetical protein
MRALGYGTLLAVVGTGTLFFGIWKLSGAHNVSSVQLSKLIINLLNLFLAGRISIKVWSNSS